MNQGSTGVSARLIFGCLFSFWICSNFFPSVFVQSQNLNGDSKCSFKCEDFKALEKRNEKLEKVVEKLSEQVKSWTQKFDQLENKILENEDVGMLRPPLRGPPGRKGDKGDPGPMDPRALRNCRDAMEIFPPPRSPKQLIYPHGNTNKVEALCDFETDGGGWTLIQKRSSGPTQDFNRTWAEYSTGFGSLDKNFWLGLENIRALTQNGDQELRIDLEDFEGETRWAKYSSFSVSDASDLYRLSINGYSENSTLDDDVINSFGVHNGMKFSTKYMDNDKDPQNCAAAFGSGWWFNSCFRANLNGLYREKGETFPVAEGIIWHSWGGYSHSLAKTQMKIRTRK